MNFSKILEKKIKKKSAIVGVIGMGYVGLPLAILIAKKGYNLYCYDKDLKRANLLRKKISYFNNIKNKELNCFNKKTSIFTNLKNISKCDIVILCLPTPLNKNNTPDLSHIRTTISKIKKKLSKGQLIILESTSYPGTTREEIYEKINKNFDVGKNFFLSFSSERINPGMNIKVEAIPKVISGFSDKCLYLLNCFYKKLFNKIVFAKSLEIAEFSKLLENIYRSVNIGFINEMKIVADKFNLDIFDVISVSNTKPFGFQRFDPGPGIGGHCIPIDPQYLYWKSKKKGVVPKFIKLSAETNLNVLKFIKNKIHLKMKIDNKNKFNTKILVLGIAYKKNVDDNRESASIKLIENLLNDNFKKIEYSDPYIKDYKFNKNIKKKSLKITRNILKKFDIVILATDHDKFNFKLVYKNSKYIIDCRGRYRLSDKVSRG